MDREQAKIRLMEEAEEQYKLALASDPKDVSTHSNYGILLKQLGRKEEAEEQYKLALASDPQRCDHTLQLWKSSKTTWSQRRSRRTV